jgi:hypothetical protein
VTHEKLQEIPVPVSMVSVGYRWAGLLTAVCGYSLVGVAEAV